MQSPFLSGSPHPSSLVDVPSTIKGLSQDFCTAYNTANYDQAALLFAADGLLMPPNYDPAQGPVAIEQLLRQYCEYGYEGLRFETLRVEHSGDIAVEVGRYTVAIRQQNSTTIADRGKYLRAWRRFGAWLIVADSWSSNLPVVK
jgi:ketosteroid isomerase-like protein